MRGAVFDGAIYSGAAYDHGLVSLALFVILDNATKLNIRQR